MSLLIATVVSLDRLVAVYQPLRYPSIAKMKTYGLTMVIIWVTMLLLGALPFIGIFDKAHYFFVVVGVMSVCLIVIILCYAAMCIAALKQRKKVPNQVAPTTLAAFSSSKGRKYRNTTAIIIGVLMICYIPQMSVLSLRGVIEDTEEILYVVDTWVDTLVFINSSLNPIIYCYRLSEFKRAFLRMIGKDEILQREDCKKFSPQAKCDVTLKSKDDVTLQDNIDLTSQAEGGVILQSKNKAKIDVIDVTNSASSSRRNELSRVLKRTDTPLSPTVQVNAHIFTIRGFRTPKVRRTKALDFTNESKKNSIA